MTTLERLTLTSYLGVARGSSAIRQSCISLFHSSLRLDVGLQRHGIKEL